ncbi:MAG: glycosyltransferase family 2 protein, partial [Terriglobia bacterium]
AKSPLVAISVLNWNGWQDTLECLRSIRALDYPHYLMIVVDNGSRNDSVARIKEWAMRNLGDLHVVAEYSQTAALAGGEDPQESALEGLPLSNKMVLICNEENLGYTGGNNVAIHYALTRRESVDYVFLLNNDATVAPDCLSELVRADQQADAGVVGATLLDETRQRVVAAGMRLDHLYLGGLSRRAPRWREGTADILDSFGPIGCAVMLRSDVLRAVHKLRGEYLESRLFMYWDELSLGHAVRQVGYKTIVARRAAACHKVVHSPGGKSSPKLYYVARNSVHVAREILPARLKLIFHLLHIPLVLAQSARNLLRQRPDFARALLCGLFDGYRGVYGKWKFHDQELAKAIK